MIDQLRYKKELQEKKRKYQFQNCFKEESQISYENKNLALPNSYRILFFL
jgi:hypothetical protein